jgi:hypothetical protein
MVGINISGKPRILIVSDIFWHNILKIHQHIHQSPRNHRFLKAMFRPVHPCSMDFRTTFVVSPNTHPPRAIVGTMASPPVGTTPLASAGAVVERLARLESHVAELQRSKLEA